jgi:hypothetical protein
MANGLYSGILDDQDQGDKKTIAARSLACYAVISINLSDSCRDVIRRLKTRDPKACWDALAAEYDQANPTTTMILLDGLLDLKCDRSLQCYISEFNLYVARLQSMGVSFHETLLMALLLRGLPESYDMFCSTVRHREKMPSLDQLFGMVKLEEKVVLRRQTGVSSAHMATPARSAALNNKSDLHKRCDVPECGKTGHTRAQCWVLHPELAPVCKKCGQSGHYPKFCRGGDAEEQQTSFAEVPPISL